MFLNWDYTYTCVCTETKISIFHKFNWLQNFILNIIWIYFFLSVTNLFYSNSVFIFKTVLVVGLDFKSSGQCSVLKQCVLIVWDECGMFHKRALEAMNRTLQDIKKSKTLIGGIVLVLATDFSQTLPVISQSISTDELNAEPKTSSILKHV